MVALILDPASCTPMQLRSINNALLFPEKTVEGRYQDNAIVDFDKNEAPESQLTRVRLVIDEKTRKQGQYSVGRSNFKSFEPKGNSSKSLASKRAAHGWR
jgi:hypothetical protein